MLFIYIHKIEILEELDVKYKYIVIEINSSKEKLSRMEKIELKKREYFLKEKMLFKNLKTEELTIKLIAIEKSGIKKEVDEIEVFEKDYIDADKKGKYFESYFKNYKNKIFFSVFNVTTKNFKLKNFENPIMMENKDILNEFENCNLAISEDLGLNEKNSSQDFEKLDDFKIDKLKKSQELKKEVKEYFRNISPIRENKNLLKTKRNGLKEKKGLMDYKDKINLLKNLDFEENLKRIFDKNKKKENSAEKKYFTERAKNEKTKKINASKDKKNSNLIFQKKRISNYISKSPPTLLHNSQKIDHIKKSSEYKKIEKKNNIQQIEKNINKKNEKQKIPVIPKSQKKIIEKSLDRNYKKKSDSSKKIKRGETEKNEIINYEQYKKSFSKEIEKKKSPLNISNKKKHCEKCILLKLNNKHMENQIKEYEENFEKKMKKKRSIKHFKETKVLLENIDKFNNNYIKEEIEKNKNIFLIQDLPKKELFKKKKKIFENEDYFFKISERRKKKLIVENFDGYFKKNSFLNKLDNSYLNPIKMKNNFFEIKKNFEFRNYFQKLNKEIKNISDSNSFINKKKIDANKSGETFLEQKNLFLKEDEKKKLKILDFEEFFVIKKISDKKNVFKKNKNNITKKNYLILKNISHKNKNTISNKIQKKLFTIKNFLIFKKFEKSENNLEKEKMFISKKKFSIFKNISIFKKEKTKPNNKSLRDFSILKKDSIKKSKKNKFSEYSEIIKNEHNKLILGKKKNIYSFKSFAILSKCAKKEQNKKNNEFVTFTQKNKKSFKSFSILSNFAKKEKNKDVLVLKQKNKKSFKSFLILSNFSKKEENKDVVILKQNNKNSIQSFSILLRFAKKEENEDKNEITILKQKTENSFQSFSLLSNLAKKEENEEKNELAKLKQKNVLLKIINDKKINSLKSENEKLLQEIILKEEVIQDKEEMLKNLLNDFKQEKTNLENSIKDKEIELNKKFEAFDKINTKLNFLINELFAKNEYELIEKLNTLN